MGLGRFRVGLEVYKCFFLVSSSFQHHVPLSYSLFLSNITQTSYFSINFLENEEQKMIFIFSGDINHSGAVAGHPKMAALPPELAFFTLFLKKKN